MYIVQHQFFAEALTGIKSCYAVAGESQRHQCGPGGWRAGAEVNGVVLFFSDSPTEALLSYSPHPCCVLLFVFTQLL